MTSVVRVSFLALFVCALILPASVSATSPVLPTPGKLTLTAPNGGEEWEVGTMNTITWTPYGYDPDVNVPSDITAYLERSIGRVINLSSGKIIPSGKASIHWETEINNAGTYAKPGKYVIRIKNNKTGEWDRSDKPFTLTPRSVDLRVNGSNGPLKLKNNQLVTLSWTTKGEFEGPCLATGVGPTASDSDLTITDLPTRGSVRAYYRGDGSIYLNCQKNENIGRWDAVQVSTAQTGSASVRVVSPNGGESLTRETQQVLYEATGVRSVSIALYKNDQFYRWLTKDHVPVAYEKGGYAFSWSDYDSTLETAGDVFKIYITGGGIGMKGYADDKSDNVFRFGQSKPVAPSKAGITAFEALPASLGTPGTTVLSWKTLGMNSCSLSQDNMTLAREVEVTGSYSAAVENTTTFRLSCRGASDGREYATASKEFKVIVGTREPVPSCTVNADKSPVAPGEEVQISWNAKYANYVVLSGGDKGAVTGSMTVRPERTTTYSVTAYGTSGKASCSTTVDVAGNTSPSVGTAQTPVISTFSASATRVSSKQPVTLRWAVTNAMRCVMSYDAVQEQVETTGALTITPYQTTTYTLWCANDPGTGKDGPSATKSITVNVVQFRLFDIGAAVGSAVSGMVHSVLGIFGK